MKSFSDWVKENNPGNYVSVNVTGLPTRYVSTLEGIVTPDPHVTLMYSKASAVPLHFIDQVLARRKLSGLQLQVVGVDVFDSQDDPEKGCIVLEVKNSALNDVHNHLLRIGCKHSYPEFKPHATLIYDVPLEQARLAAQEIKAKLYDEGLFLTCTTTNNQWIKENWAKEAST